MRRLGFSANSCYIEDNGAVLRAPYVDARAQTDEADAVVRQHNHYYVANSYEGECEDDDRDVVDDIH